MGFTNYAVENFISKRITEITCVGPADLSPEFPNASAWLSRLGMLAILTNQFAPEIRPFAIQFVRRTEMALAEYTRARSELVTLLGGTRRWSPYFRALHHIEVSASMLYQAYDLSRKKLKTDLFQSGDGSPLQRLNLIYNTSKHQAADADDPIWLSDVSIHTPQTELTYRDFEELLRSCARIAERITTTQTSKADGAAAQ